MSSSHCSIIEVTFIVVFAREDTLGFTRIQGKLSNFTTTSLLQSKRSKHAALTGPYAGFPASWAAGSCIPVDHIHCCWAYHDQSQCCYTLTSGAIHHYHLQALHCRGLHYALRTYRGTSWLGMVRSSQTKLNIDITDRHHSYSYYSLYYDRVRPLHCNRWRLPGHMQFHHHCSRPSPHYPIRDRHLRTTHYRCLPKDL